MKRFDPNVTYHAGDYGYPSAVMNELSDGDYVLYSDAQAEIDRMTKNRDDCAKVFEIGRLHSTGGINGHRWGDCECPSCFLHMCYKVEIDRLTALLKASEEEMLFWRHEHGEEVKDVDRLNGEVKALQKAFDIEWEEAERLKAENQRLNEEAKSAISYAAMQEIKQLKAENERYREALEKIRTDTGNRPGHETWGYYCERLWKLCLVADSALKAQPDIEIAKRLL